MVLFMVVFCAGMLAIPIVSLLVANYSDNTLHLCASDERQRLSSEDVAFVAGYLRSGEPDVHCGGYRDNLSASMSRADALEKENEALRREIAKLQDENKQLQKKRSSKGNSHAEHDEIYLSSMDASKEKWVITSSKAEAYRVVKGHKVFKL